MPVVATSEPVFVSILFASVELLLLFVIVIFCDVELNKIIIVPSGLLLPVLAGFVIPVMLKTPVGPVILTKLCLGKPMLLLAPLDSVNAPIGSCRLLDTTLSTFIPALESNTVKKLVSPLIKLAK